MKTTMIGGGPVFLAAGCLGLLSFASFAACSSSGSGGSGGSGGAGQSSSSQSSSSQSSSSSSSSSSGTGGAPAQGLDKIQHIVVIYLENHSFDNLYGEFAGAEGLNNGNTFAMQNKQLDAMNNPYATLPPDPEKAPVMPFLPANLPNAPFNLDQYIPANWNSPPMGMSTPDVTHRYYHEIQQIDGGKMDKFVVLNGSLGLAMGYYHTAGLALAAEATKYTLCDHFFHAAFGGSFLNHQWLIAAATPLWEGDQSIVPKPMYSTLNPDGTFIKDAQLTPDGHVVNTSYSVNAPLPPIGPNGFIPDKTYLVPSFTNPTIGDELIAANITWAWYSGGWDAAIGGNADPNFQYHHQPFAYYKTFADGTPAKAKYLLDETKFFTAAMAGTLPAVSFIKPIGAENEHPAYADITTGEKHALDLINAVRNGPEWGSTAIIVTYDENGGFWDHVPPPKGDVWGPGSRVPAIVISPYAKKGFIDKTVYDTTSILALIEHRFKLASLSTRDKAAPDLTAAFDFSQ